MPIPSQHSIVCDVSTSAGARRDSVTFNSGLATSAAMNARGSAGLSKGGGALALVALIRWKILRL